MKRLGLVAALLLATGCHDYYLVRADQYDPVKTQPPSERADVELAAERLPDMRPVNLKLDHVEQVKNNSDGQYLVKARNELAITALAFLGGGAAHFATGIGLMYSGGYFLINDGFLVAGGIQLLVAAVIGVMGLMRPPAESATKPRFDAAAGVLRF